MELELSHRESSTTKERYLKVLVEALLHNRKVSYYLEKNIASLANSYLKNHDLSSLLDEFENLPLTTYENYIKYIDEIFNKGESNILSPGYPIWFAKSGGTTGAPKVFPIFMNPAIEECFSAFPSESAIESIASIKKLKIRKDMKGLSLIWKSTKHLSPLNNIPVGFSSSMIQIPSSDIEPSEIKYISSHKDHLKISILFNLLEEDLEYITSVFINIVVDLFTVLEENKLLFIYCLKNRRFIKEEELEEDLNEGQFSLLSEKFMNVLEARTERCEFLISTLEKFSSHNDFKHFAIKIWPKLKIICSNFSSITLDQQLNLSKFYTSDKLLYINYLYGCSETLLGMPSYFTENGYKVSDKIYPEFILYDIEKDEHLSTKVSPIWTLELNQHYEIVVTTYTGYVRYKIGDIVKTIGWHDGVPVIEFVKRIGWSLVSGGYRIDDKYVTDGIKKTELPMKHSIAYNNISIQPSGFGFFVELESNYYDSFIINPLNSFIHRKSEEKLNAYFSEVNECYQEAVKKGKISRAIINFVPKGTFDQYKLFKAKKTGASSLIQIKIPITLTDPYSISFFEKASKLVI